MTTIADWLNEVHDGLGVHAHILEGYGVAVIALMGVLDDEDISAIADALRTAEGGPAPLQIKLIQKALAAEVKRHADASASASRTPATDPVQRTMRFELGSGSEDDECFNESAEDESEAESSGDESMPKRNTGKAAGAAASASTQRSRSRKGRKAAGIKVAAAAAGKAPIPHLFSRSSSKQNWHGWGGQAKAASAAGGRARPFGGLARRSKGQCCVNPCGQDLCMCTAGAETQDACMGDMSCARLLQPIADGARVAATRTPLEIAKRGGTLGEYNYARLKVNLLQSAFTAQGNAVVHLACLRAKLSVGFRFLSDIHRCAIERAGSKTESITKARVISLKLTEEQVLRPDGSLGSLSTYLSTLNDEDMVNVVTQVGTHGLKGQPSNGASYRERAFFIEFIKEHRSPTRRTQDSSGRYHDPP